MPTKKKNRVVKEQDINKGLALDQSTDNGRQALAQIGRKEWDIKFRSSNQKRFYDLMCEKDIVICTGPAGVGKTWLASYFSLVHLANKLSPYKKILITKPMVEADDEKIGFLPGGIDEKCYPFMLSYYYNMEKLIDRKQLNKLLEFKHIEVLPLAYMRGITFSDIIVILDEAQNTSPEQMKMFLTRIGERCKYIIIGDPLQNDRGNNGLIDCMDRFRDVSEIGMFAFGREDIVRHPLILKILEHYEDIIL